MPRRCSNDEERFWSKTVRDTATGCLIWIAARTHGYGIFSIQNKVIRANRWALEHKLGRPLAPGMFACHTCDNRACVEPDHLYEGSLRDNTDDAVARDRVAWGERSGTHKLTEERVRVIMRMHSRGFSQRAIAAQFGVHQSTVSRIVRGRRWSRLEVSSASA